MEGNKINGIYESSCFLVFDNFKEFLGSVLYRIFTGFIFINCDSTCLSRVDCVIISSAEK